VVAITEVTGSESGRIQTQDLFRYESRGLSADGRNVGVFRACGNEPAFFESLPKSLRPGPLNREGPRC
jgi:pilus assembly protein CpaF